MKKSLKKPNKCCLGQGETCLSELSGLMLGVLVCGCSKKEKVVKKVFYSYYSMHREVFHDQSLTCLDRR